MVLSLIAVFVVFIVMTCAVAVTLQFDGKTLYQKLKSRGVLVRHFDKARISDYVRITVGTLEEMQTLITKIGEILEETK